MCEQKSERPEPPFKVGDVVTLKSGGFACTVTEVFNEGCDCRWSCTISWFSGDVGLQKKLKTVDEIPADCLKHTEAPDETIPF